jgi:spore coat protein CotH
MPPAVGPGTVIPEPQDAATYVFDPSIIRTYNLVIAPADLATIDMDPSAETYVNGMLEFEGQTYGPIGVRYKGSVGAFITPCTAATTVGTRTGPKTGKCSMKLDFDRVNPDLRFYGLKKLNFHSMDRDKSMLRDRLGYTLFREFGVAASRATHARLMINGKLEGLYIAVEDIDGRFTHSRFSDGGDGNLYKEVWPVSDSPEPYLAALETNEEANPSVDKMLRFEEAIDTGAATAEQWFDKQYMYDYIAADRVMINDDGAFHWYCNMNHNYYWYEGESADRVWLIPWDLDSSFQNGTFVHIAAPWDSPATRCTCVDGQRPAICDRLTSEWATDIPEYVRAVDAFLAGPFSDANIAPKLAAWTAQIDTAVQEAAGLNGAPTYADWQAALTMLRSIVDSARLHRGYDYGSTSMIRP